MVSEFPVFKSHEYPISNTVKKYVCHSRKVLELAALYGWEPGARYTNLRDVRGVSQLGFLDINWKDYDFERHLAAAKAYRPEVTVAQDVVDRAELSKILDQAERLSEYANTVIVVPKDLRLAEYLTSLIPSRYRLGYSVPTRYGGTEIPISAFGQREIHLLGGRPDVQRDLANRLNVASLDTNRFTLDAGFGDYFDGEKFRPHPTGGYEVCLKASLENMNAIWQNYRHVAATMEKESE
ncbi:MAG: hypothetical protein CML99_11840 [Rhodobiaceae bacterium]|nr:hypothetical protein [Rhodobiaceae bacterium]|tara:strand:+ start:250 stop:963 length:714 start_codon:yes stop_codon:yes gene_type:complete